MCCNSSKPDEPALFHTARYTLLFPVHNNKLVLSNHKPLHRFKKKAGCTQCDLLLLPVQGLYHDFVCCAVCSDWPLVRVASLCVLGVQWLGDGVLCVPYTYQMGLSWGFLFGSVITCQGETSQAIWMRSVTGFQAVSQSEPCIILQGCVAMLAMEIKPFCTSFRPGHFSHH